MSWELVVEKYLRFLCCERTILRGILYSLWNEPLWDLVPGSYSYSQFINTCFIDFLPFLFTLCHTITMLQLGKEASRSTLANPLSLTHIPFYPFDISWVPSLNKILVIKFLYQDLPWGTQSKHKVAESLAGKWNYGHDNNTILFVLWDQQRYEVMAFLEVSFWTATAGSWIITKMRSALFGETTRTSGQSS